MSVSDLVGEIDGLRERTRRASFGGALPLAVLGALVAGTAPLYAAAFRETHPSDGSGSYGLVDLLGDRSKPLWLLRLLRVHPGGEAYQRLSVYWVLAVPVAFGLIAAWYAWRARRTGLSLDGWRVALVGAGVLAALLATVERGVWLTPGYAGNDLQPGNFVNPLLVVVAGAFAIAWVERSKAVLAVAVVFLLGVLMFDVSSYAGVSEAPYQNIQSVGTGALVIGGWLLASAGVLGAVRARRRG
jgi:hypothetical protein